VFVRAEIVDAMDDAVAFAQATFRIFNVRAESKS